MKKQLLGNVLLVGVKIQHTLNEIINCASGISPGNMDQVHQVKVKVTGEKKGRKSLFLQ